MSPRSTWDRYAFDRPIRRSTSRRESWRCLRARRRTPPICGGLWRAAESVFAEGSVLVDPLEAWSIIVLTSVAEETQRAGRSVMFVSMCRSSSQQLLVATPCRVTLACVGGKCKARAEPGLPAVRVTIASGQRRRSGIRRAAAPK